MFKRTLNPARVKTKPNKNKKPSKRPIVQEKDVRNYKGLTLEAAKELNKVLEFKDQKVVVKKKVFKSSKANSF